MNDRIKRKEMVICMQLHAVPGVSNLQTVLELGQLLYPSLSGLDWRPSSEQTQQAYPGAKGVWLEYLLAHMPTRDNTFLQYKQYKTIIDQRIFRM